MNDLGPCHACGHTVYGYELHASLLQQPPAAAPTGLAGEIDERSSILTLIPCGCHILGTAGQAINLLLASTRREPRK